MDSIIKMLVAPHNKLMSTTTQILITGRKYPIWKNFLNCV